MNPRLHIDPTLPTPIGSQIEEGVRHLVASGRLGPGTALPSVRDLARAHRINPNTVAKAYQRLAASGVVAARRGEGTFVAERPPALSTSTRTKLLREGAQRFTAVAVTIGVTVAEATEAVRAGWPETAGRGGRGDAAAPAPGGTEVRS
jgi:GntR family transcriptional regulator